MSHLAAFTASLEAVSARCADVVPPVYAALFERFPDFEKLFVLDTDQGARGHMLNEALTMAEGLLRADPVAISFVSAERMNHEGYGIDDTVFEGFFEVMANVFQALAGEAWSAPMSAAWAAVSEAAAQAKL
ncbi:MAG: globin domain-containing protein [Pseudomonadota bacterium]